MTVEQLLQFYAPLAGLLAVVFWLGMLTQRVRDLEKTTDDRERRVKALEMGDATDRDERDRLVRVEAELEHHGKSLESIDRALAGINRQLATIATGRGGTVVDLGKG